MSNLSDDYKAKYELIFQGDLKFSARFTPEIKKIIGKLNLPQKINNNLGTQKDLEGSDFTLLPLEIAVRVRRAHYEHYDQYTEDDNERDNMEPDVGMFGYATEDESGLQSLIVFDHRDFRKARRRGLLKSERRRNKKHSGVWFTCYSIWDIRKYCKIYGKRGEIGWKGEEPIVKF